MNDAIITEDEIFVQDVVCSIVHKNVKSNNVSIYNNVIRLVDVPNFETALKIIQLININKVALLNS